MKYKVLKDIGIRGKVIVAGSILDETVIAPIKHITKKLIDWGNLEVVDETKVESKKTKTVAKPVSKPALKTEQKKVETEKAEPKKTEVKKEEVKKEASEVIEPKAQSKVESKPVSKSVSKKSKNKKK